MRSGVLAEQHEPPTLRERRDRIRESVCEQLEGRPVVAVSSWSDRIRVAVTRRIESDDITRMA
jgi:hypothetical protein